MIYQIDLAEDKRRLLVLSAHRQVGGCHVGGDVCACSSNGADHMIRCRAAVVSACDGAHRLRATTYEGPEGTAMHEIGRAHV